MIVCLKKLKAILQYNWLFFGVFILSFVYGFIYVSIPRISIYNGDETNFRGIINDIYIEGNYLKLEVLSKEKLQVTYYFSTLDEKNNFIDNYKLGDTIYLEGKLKIPSNNTIPNLFNYKEYLYYDNTYYILELETYEKIHSNKNLIYSIKNYIIGRINTITKSSSYLKALILGSKDELKEITPIYQEIGISHLLAISGMHISIFSGILLFCLKGLNEKIKYFIVLSFLFLYLLITGCSPSILRSVVFFFFLSINKIFKLNVKTLNVYLFSISLIVIINPFIIFNIGFQYSALISGSLILFSRLINNCKNYFGKLLITSFLSFLIGLPISLYNFHQINILGFIYNLLFVPFMSFVLFPLSIITFICPFLDNILHFIINIFEYLGKLCSIIPTTLVFRKLDIWIYVVYMILIFLVIKTKFRKKGLIIILVFLLLIHYNYNFIFKSTYMLAIDVGQGDSILLHSNNNSILIDTGGKMFNLKDIWMKRNIKSITENTIVPLLKSLGIGKLNYLILTHGDYDHMGEAINLVENFKVEKIIFNCGSFNDLEKDLIKVLDKKKIPYYSCIKELNIDDNKLYFLNNKDYGNENDNSSVIYTELNNYKFLFMGDAGVEVEDYLLKKYNLKDIDVLKVGHHGSRTSTSKLFIDEINPKYSIISVGKNNRYGHPNKEVLDNLNDSKIYRTDQDGSIMFKIKNDKLKIDTCSP